MSAKRDPVGNFLGMVKRGELLKILAALRARLIWSTRWLLRLIGLSHDSPNVRRRMLNRLLNENYGWIIQMTGAAKVKAAVIAPNGDTYPYSSTFIRLLSPLSDPSLHGKLKLDLLPESADDAGDVAVVIVQRTAVRDLDQAKRLVENLEAKKQRLIIDTDDAFHSIDKSHPEYAAQTARLAAFEYLVKQADMVWVSTPALASYFKKQTKARVELVINSLDKRIWRSAKNIQARGPLKLLYMGTASHDADFKMVLEALDKIEKRSPGEFQLMVAGALADAPQRSWLKVLYAGANGTIYPRYVPWLLRQGPWDIGLAPLVDSEFNRNKSDIKCLDYLAAGCLPVVSDIEPYQNPELDKYLIRVKNTPKAWETALADLVADREALRTELPKLISAGQKYVWAKRSSDQTAKQLWALVESVVKK